MISAAIDTNVLVRGVIAAHDASAGKRVLDAFLLGKFALLLSPEILDETSRVLAAPAVRERHGWSDAEIVRFCRTLETGARMVKPLTAVSPSLTRDVTDVKWIALVLDAHANYLVTYDMRHLGRLKRVGQTRIVTPMTFLRDLDRVSQREQAS